MYTLLMLLMAITSFICIRAFVALLGKPDHLFTCLSVRVSRDCMCVFVRLQTIITKRFEWSKYCLYVQRIYSSLIMAHNCKATADRAVVVFVKEFQRDQRPQPLQNSLIHHPSNY